jgi:hypothetical protein
MFFFFIKIQKNIPVYSKCLLYRLLYRCHSRYSIMHLALPYSKHAWFLLVIMGVGLVLWSLAGQGTECVGCSGGKTCCHGGWCTNILEDDLNCGSCGNQCITWAGEICVEGVCINQQTKGYTPKGEECWWGWECQSGICTGADGWSMVCSDVLGGIGDFCSEAGSCLSGYCNRWSHQCSSGEVGQGCMYTADCVSGICTGADGWSMVCSESLGDLGGICFEPASCLSGYCNRRNSVCSSGGIGQGCLYNVDCFSGKCKNRVCLDSLGEIGDRCREPANCLSGYCNRGILAMVCSSGANGVGCRYNVDCLSGKCKNGICSDSLGELGDACLEPASCQSGYCNRDWILCSSGEDGQWCVYNVDCISGKCASKTCIP